MKNLSLEEKLALIEEANRLRQQYFDLLGYKKFLLEKKEYLSNHGVEAEKMLFFLNPIIQKTFSTNGSGVYSPTESLMLLNSLVQLLIDFHTDVSNGILKKLNNLQIYFNGGENETGL